jgi:hypothetical protein
MSTVLSHSSRPLAAAVVSRPVQGLPPGPSTPSFVQTYRYARNPLPLLDECAQRFGEIFTLRLDEHMRQW